MKEEEDEVSGMTNGAVKGINCKNDPLSTDI